MNNNNKKQVNPEGHTHTTIKAKEVHLKENYKFFNNNFFFRLWSTFLIYLFFIFYYTLYDRLLCGLRIKNKKIYKKHKNEGLILISNHVYQWDAVAVGCTCLPRKSYITMLQSNLGIPFAGKLLNWVGGVPIPTDSNALMIKFLKGVKHQVVEKKRKLVVLPEAYLKPYHPEIRPFFPGAFRFAADTDAKIIPIVFCFKKAKGFYKLTRRRKPRVEMHFLEPIIAPDTFNKKSEKINWLSEKAHEVMSKYYLEHSTYFIETNKRKKA